MTSRSDANPHKEGMSFWIQLEPHLVRALFAGFFHHPRRKMAYLYYLLGKYSRGYAPTTFSSFAKEAELIDYKISRLLTSKGCSHRKIYYDAKVELRIDILEYLSSINQGIKVCLDFGAGSGELTMLTAQHTPKIRWLAADLPSWGGHSNLTMVRPPVRAVFIEGKELKFIPENSVDCIFTDFVLHHLSPLERRRVYSSWRRYLRDNGFLIIREHDICTQQSEAFVQCQHLLYAAKENLSHPVYSDYLSIGEWLEEWQREGFKQILISRSMGPARKFFIVLSPFKR